MTEKDGALGFIYTTVKNGQKKGVHEWSQKSGQIVVEKNSFVCFCLRETTVGRLVSTIAISNGDWITKHFSYLAGAWVTGDCTITIEFN